MNKENSDRLVDRFERLISVPEGRSKWSFEFNCGDGWARLIEHTLEQLQVINVRGLEVICIKQQLAKLYIIVRFWKMPSYKAKAMTMSILNIAGEQSRTICEECAAPGEKREIKSGVLKTLCDACAAKLSTKNDIPVHICGVASTKLCRCDWCTTDECSACANSDD